MKNFDFDGERYRSASAGQKEWGHGLISSLVLSGSERILDLGCGDGILSAELARLVPQGSVLGIDASEGMLAAARQCELPNLTFQRMDILDLAFENAFDVVFSNAALHWVKDHRRMLARVLAALRPHGLIAFNFAGRGTCQTFIPVVRRVMRQPEYQDFFQHFTWPWYMPHWEDYREDIMQAGFVNLEVREENRDRLFPTRDAIISWIDQPTIVPFLSALPEEQREEFEDRVVKQMLDASRQTDGSYRETFRRIHVLAEKP